MAQAFVGSPEFQNTYGATDNAAFVTLPYNNVLDRGPDAAGLGNWTGRLDSGAMTRAEVVLGFSQSVERTGFGYTTAADLRPHLTRDGPDTVFRDQGVEIVFLQTPLGALPDDVFAFA